MTVIQEKICTILGWRWYYFSYHRNGMRGGCWIDHCVSFEQHHPKKGQRPGKFKNVRLAKDSDFTWKGANVWYPSYDAIPHFETDLNAMHAAYLALSERARREFNRNLMMLTERAAHPRSLGPYNATALQRAQAFIMAHNRLNPKKRK